MHGNDCPSIRATASHDPISVTIPDCFSHYSAFCLPNAVALCISHGCSNNVPNSSAYHPAHYSAFCLPNAIALCISHFISNPFSYASPVRCYNNGGG